jgi:hypothetical protein
MSLRSQSETKHAVISAAAGTTTVVAAPTGSAGINAGVLTTRIYKIIVTVGTTATLQIQDTANNVLSQTFSFGANGGSITLDIPINGEFWWGGAAGTGLQFVVTGATVSADIWYIQGV